MDINKHKYKIIDINNFTKHTYKLSCERNNFEFKSGQCVNIGLVGSGINREYSTYSSENDNKLEFLIREIKGGLVSEGLKKLYKGDYVQIHGSYGSFCINPSNINKKHIFIATGTGIAPFSSFIKTYPDLKYDLIHGVSYENELYDYLFYKKECIHGCVSREKTKKHFYGRVTDFLKSYDLSNEFVYYICGNGNMISEVYDHITSNSIESKNIFMESFFQ